MALEAAGAAISASSTCLRSARHSWASASSVASAEAGAAASRSRVSSSRHCASTPGASRRRLARLAAPFRCRLDSPRCACTRRTACSNVATGRAPAASRRFCAAVSHDALTYSSNGRRTGSGSTHPAAGISAVATTCRADVSYSYFPIVWPGFPPCLACRDRQNSFNPLTAEGLQTIELLHGRFALSQTGAEFSAPRGRRGRALS